MNPESALRVILEAFNIRYGGQARFSTATTEQLVELLNQGYERAVQRAGGLYVYEAEVQALATQLVESAQLERFTDGSTRVSPASVDVVIDRLCPIWPFCR